MTRPPVSSRLEDAAAYFTAPDYMVSHVVRVRATKVSGHKTGEVVEYPVRTSLSGQALVDGYNREHWREGWVYEVAS